MTSSACCYTISPNFLLQSLVSATQIRQFTPRHACDIFIICFGNIQGDRNAIKDYCSINALSIIEVSHSELFGLPFGCARFKIDAILPKSYDTIIYLDADTQVCASLLPLLNIGDDSVDVCATLDPMALVVDTISRIGRSSRAHFDALGLTANHQYHYFNSGVLRVKRKRWAEISRECVEIINSSKRKLQYLDQDALNMVVGARYARLSLRWNFPGFLLGSDSQMQASPCIVHFMSRPRPWDGPFTPWGPAWHRPYLGILAAIPSLRQSVPTLSRIQYLRYTMQTLVKRQLERDAWNSDVFRNAVLFNESSAVV